jgi:hypothetical protein
MIASDSKYNNGNFMNAFTLYWYIKGDTCLFLRPCKRIQEVVNPKRVIKMLSNLSW